MTPTLGSLGYSRGSVKRATGQAGQFCATGRSPCEMVATRFSWEQVARRFEEILETPSSLTQTAAGAAA